MDPTLYESDIVAWADQQVGELRRLAAEAPSNRVDWTNVIEEIEGVGRSHVSGVERKLGLILAHLLKVLSAPDSPAVRGWRAEIGSHQRVVRKQFSNAMRRLIDMDSVWADAKQETADALLEWGDGLVRGLPASCPVRIDDLVDAEFDVDAVLARLADALLPSAGR